MFRTYHLLKNQNNYKVQSKIHSELGLNSTLFLAYRDLPELLKRNLFNFSKKEKYRLLDFGCGAGLSTEIFFKIITNMGYDVEVNGIDICDENLILARKRLPIGHFYKIEKGQPINSIGLYDIIVCNFVLLENSYKEMVPILNQIKTMLNDSGIAIITNCTKNAYKKTNKWYSIKNDFEENNFQCSPSGKLKIEEDQPVKIQIHSFDTGASFSFFDFFHSGRAYREAYMNSGFKLQETHKPIGKGSDGIAWKDEEKVSPYKIHILRKNQSFDSYNKNLISIRSKL